MFAIFYGKIVDDKEDGIYLADVCFGGVALTNMEAEKVARDCVNSVRGGTIFPKIYPLSEQQSLVPVMRQAVQKFREIETQMFNAEDILENNQRRR